MSVELSLRRYLELSSFMRESSMNEMTIPLSDKHYICETHQFL